MAAGLQLVPGALRASHPTCARQEWPRLAGVDTTAGDNFGISVAVSGPRAVVGAWRDSDAGVSSGSAYVFRFDDNATPLDPGDDIWVQEDKLRALDAAAFDRFGRSVSINNDHIVVGAILATGVTSDTGAAYVFRLDDNGTPLDLSDDGWVQESKLTAADGIPLDDFGVSVAISGDWVVVGAYRNDDACPKNPDCNSGAAYMFRHDDNATPSDPSDDTWIPEGKLTALDAAEDDHFGLAVAIAGDRVVVGAFLSDDGGTDSGSAYVFRRDDNETPSDPSDDQWIQEFELTPSDPAESDSFGISVSITTGGTGDRVVVGSHHTDDTADDSGSAYIFRREDNETPSDPSDDFWVEEDRLSAPNPAEGDQFGESVSISGDRAVVGSRFEDATGENSGSAYVFRREDNGTPTDANDDFWVPEVRLSASDTSEGDQFGVSVAIRGDRAVVGAWRDEDAGASSGAAYAFSVARECADLTHYADFQSCFTGDGGGLPPDCGFFDFDRDNDVDLVDHTQFLHTFAGR